MADIALLNEKGECIEVVGVGIPVTLQVKVSVHAPIPRLVLGYMIKDRLGQVMYGTNTHIKELPQLDVQSGEQVIYNLSFPMNLGPGSYSITVALTSASSHYVDNFEWCDVALVFNVINIGYPHFSGCVWLDPSISIVR